MAVAESLSLLLTPLPFMSAFPCSMSGPIRNIPRGCQHLALIITLGVLPSIPLLGWEQWLALPVSTLFSRGPTFHVAANIVKTQLRSCAPLSKLSIAQEVIGPVIHGRHLSDPIPTHCAHGSLEHILLPHRLLPQTSCSGFRLGIPWPALYCTHSSLRSASWWLSTAPSCAHTGTHALVHLHMYESPQCIHFPVMNRSPLNVSYRMLIHDVFVYRSTTSV